MRLKRLIYVILGMTFNTIIIIMCKLIKFGRFQPKNADCSSVPRNLSFDIFHVTDEI